MGFRPLCRNVRSYGGLGGGDSVLFWQNDKHMGKLGPTPPFWPVARCARDEFEASPAYTLKISTWGTTQRAI